jgi:hypothetical protein
MRRRDRRIRGAVAVIEKHGFAMEASRLRDLADIATLRRGRANALENVCFDRATGFVERRVEGASGIIELPTVGRALPLTGIYRGTGLL